MNKLLVYKASAGSGKTFTLAVEYIKLLILNPRAYQQILAVTFTNKATAEMKERILSQLHGIHTGDPGSKAYLQRLQEETGKSEADIREAAGTALGYILHDYSRFRVETIDSFFQSVMRNLARELELSPNLNIELDNKEIINKAVDSMIEKLGPTSPVLAWLLDYINERIAEDKRWNVSKELKSFAENIFKEEYIEKGEQLRQTLRNPSFMPHYRNQLKELRDEALNEMKDFSDAFNQALDDNDLTGDDFKNKSKGIASYFKKLGVGTLGDKERNKTVEECLADADNWVTKPSKKDLAEVDRKERAKSLVESFLMELLHRAEDKRPVNNRIVNSCKLALKHLEKVQLLNQVDEEIRELNQQNNRFLLSDTNALLHRLVGDGDSSFVFEKIGTNIRNVMIDEFQDTSRMQWGNFKLLLLEGLSQGADSLIVGDVKQSIYRWRAGDWSILNGLKGNLLSFPIEERTLVTNRRSESRIIEFNNRVFTQAMHFFRSRSLEMWNESCDELLQAYADVAQESPKSEEKGYVKVTLLKPIDKESEEEISYVEQTAIAMGEEVKRLLAEGVALNDIAIIFRFRTHIPAIAQYFDEVLHYKVVSDEAFCLNASLAIRILINALRFLADEEQVIACGQLVVDYQTRVLQNDAELHVLLHGDPEPYLPAEFLRRREELRLMPLYELLEELFILFELSRIENQDAYLFSFFDEVIDYLQKNPSDIERFLQFWDEKLNQKAIPSGEVDGIRIFTIHKSKGLEFHTVLLPFCDWKLENDRLNYVWVTPTQAPFNELNLLPIDYMSGMKESVFQDDFRREQLQLWVDNLNLLYVAFTRAGSNLIVWGKKKGSGTLSELLGNVLDLPMAEPKSKASSKKKSEATSEAEPEDTDSVFEFGTVCPSKKSQKAHTETNKLLQPAEKHPIRMESLRHQVQFQQSNRSADFIKGVEEDESDHRFINRGLLLHTLFSSIETKDDIQPAIERLVFEGVIDNQEKEELVQELVEKAFALPEVQDWYTGEWTLFNECNIVYKVNGEVQTRRPDRVMMKDGQVVVVDFKFGKEFAKYKAQVKEYIQLLKQMGYTHISGYLWYVDQEKIVAVK